jgi:DNA-binding NtrC family response regulator
MAQEPTFDEILDAIEHLPRDQQADLLRIIQRRLAERGRQQIAQDVREAVAEFVTCAKPASVDEIMREIDS